MSSVKVRGASNRSLGSIILVTSFALFGFYTFWAIFLPFLPDDSILHSLFPSRKWALVIPSLILVVGLSTVGIYIGFLLRADLLQLIKESEMAKKQQ